MRFALLGLLVLLAGCGGSVACPPASTTSSPGISEGQLALAKLACKRYPDTVLPSQNAIYQVNTFQHPTGVLLHATFSQDVANLARIAVPARSALYSDMRAVSSSLASLAQLSTPTYRKPELGPAIRSFNSSDLAVSSDCQAIYQQ